MAYTPAELLVHGGVISADEHHRALAHRDAQGSSIGESLVALGFITEEDLAFFYHKRLLLPLVEEARLVQIPPKVLARIPVELATEFRVIPIQSEDDGALLVVMADPADNHAIEELGFFTGSFVMRAVATESSIRRALARHYAKKSSDLQVRAKPRPAPVAPPPTVAEPIVPRASFIDGPRHEPLPRKKPPVTQPVAEPVLLLTRRKPKPEPPLAEEPVVLLTRKRGRDRTGTLPGLQPEVNAPAPVAGLRAAKDREAVATLLLEYAAQLLGRAVLFVVSKDALRGYHARGAGLDRASVEVLQIPLSTPSQFREVVRTRLPFRGPLADSPQARAIGRVLGLEASADVVLLPIVVAGRVVAVLFGDQIARDIPESALQITLHEAGMAYERLILEARSRAQT